MNHAASLLAPPVMAPPQRERVMLVVLLIIVVLAYANAFGGSFQFDDFNVIVREASVQSVSAWWRSQPGIRPLLKLSYALNHESGFGLVGFHVLNLGVHAANSLLVWALMHRLAPATGADPAGQRRIAWLTAAIFALHPVQTEAVTYLSGRSTSLAALFALASIVLWLRGRASKRALDVHLWSPLVLAAALACKEYAVVVPAALLLCARLQSERSAWCRSAWRDARVHAAVVMIALLAACAVPRYRLLLETSLATRDLAGNLLTQAQAVLYLLGQLLRLDNLNADPALPVIAQWDVLAMLPALAWLALLGWGLTAPPRHRVPAFALLWFLLWLLPTNSVLPRLDVANDRQLYVAIIGPAFMLAAGSARRLRSTTQAWLAAIVVVVLAVSTWQRNHVYADELSYWGDVAAKSPHNARAFANLGHALALQCRPEEAGRAFEVAVELDPGMYQAVIKLRLLRDGSWRC